MTHASEGNLPEFKNPPVIEVALSVVFQPLQGYTSAHAGLFWTRVSGQFPRVEEQAPIAIPDELEAPQFVDDGLRFESMKNFPRPRIWLVSANGNELLQIQEDTFSCNWRQQIAGTSYPRYDHVKSLFSQNFQQFSEFAEQAALGAIAPTRCEVSYVNHIPAGQGWERFGEFHKILSGYADKRHVFLPEAEEVRYNAKFGMRNESGQFLGRLTVSALPAVRRSDKKPLIALTLTSRGRPVEAGISGVLAFFDLGREWIVRGFTDLTTDEMHRMWGRIR